MHKIQGKESDGVGEDDYCFMRFKENGKCYSLTISGTELRKICDETIWEKCQLEKLNLMMNKLEKLPRQLLKFKDSITLVCIQNNRFKEIPEILYEFKKMEHLNMHGNLLPSIPERFKEFIHLSRIHLGDNDLDHLPDVFENLKQLKEANFQNNNLTRLPKSFSQLCELESLDISHNAFIKFPESILPLKKLKILNVEWNRLHKISPSRDVKYDVYQATFEFIGHLSDLQLKGNPLRLQSHEGIKEKSDKEILKVLQNAKNFKYLSEIKPTRSLRVNVLGESGAGKTSVVQAFAHDKYVIPTTKKDHKHTVGIERYIVPVEMEGKIIQLHIWDHAGDDEYAMMNDLFISERSLVWIVVNMRVYSPKDYHHFIGKWLYQVMTHNTKPVVWIICTHKDECNKDSCSKNIEGIREFTKGLCKSFRSSLEKKIEQAKSEGFKLKELDELQKKNVPNFLEKNMEVILLSNSYDFYGHEKLNELLRSLPSKFDGVFENLKADLPVEWENKIDELFQPLASSSSLPSNVIMSDADINRFLSSNKDENNRILKYCHEVGEIYIDKKNETERLIILDIKWLINYLKKVYHHKFEKFIKKLNISDDCQNEAIRNRKNHGVIPKNILMQLWNCDNEDLFESIIGLFSKFDLTYCHEEGKDKAYFFPYLIMSDKSVLEKPDDFSNYRTMIKMKLDFLYILPKFFLQRLALKLSHDPQCTELIIKSDHFLYKMDHSRFYITSSGTKNVIESVLCISAVSNVVQLWEVLSSILKQIRSLLKDWHFLGRIMISVTCPKCIIEKEAEVNSPMHIELIQARTVQCCKCRASVPLEIPINFVENMSEWADVDKFKQELSEDQISTESSSSQTSSLSSSISTCSSSSYESQYDKTIPPPQQATDS